MAKVFRERLSDLLKSRRMSQKTLAEKTNITESAVSRYIKGDYVPKISTMSKIADALGTTTDYLIYGTEYDFENEIAYATHLIARNISNMSKTDKMEIVSILLGDEIE